MEQNTKDRRRAQALRKQQTKEENHLWYDFLKRYPVQFRRQYPIGPYYADFFCYRAKLVIELDGSGHYEPEAQKKDQIRSAYLEAQGYTVIRFSNLDVWQNFGGVCETIDAEVRTKISNI